MEIYLDNSATTKPYPEVIEAMASSMLFGYYNPAALYAPAVAAEHALAEARAAVAAPLLMKQENVIFTSGGTESNNLAILGCLKRLRGGGTVLYSAAEHAAVRNACLEAEAMGFTVRQIPLDARGSLDLQALEAMLDETVRLICVMQVCNETGIVMPLKEVSVLRDRLAPQAALHVDGVQGYLRLPLNMKQLNIQTYAVSAHKVHGPKGMGALIVQTGHKLRPLLVGGGQQNGLRSGTDNTSGAAGFAAAVRRYPADAADTMRALKAQAVESLQKAIPAAVSIGPGPEDADSAPHILCVSIPPVKAETMVHALAQENIIVGTGSACSSHARKHSAVLTAMGVSPRLMDSAIRISLCDQNTEADVQTAVRAMAEQYAVLSKFTRR